MFATVIILPICLQKTRHLKENRPFFSELFFVCVCFRRYIIVVYSCTGFEIICKICIASFFKSSIFDYSMNYLLFCSI